MKRLNSNYAAFRLSSFVCFEISLHVSCVMWIRQYAPAIVRECIRAIVSLRRNIFSFNVVWFRSHSDNWKMSWRFKASKYKNAAPKVPKPDEWVRDLCSAWFLSNHWTGHQGLSIIYDLQCWCSRWEIQILSINVLSDWFVDLSVGSNLYVIPLNETGIRKPKNYPLLHAHSDWWLLFWTLKLIG